MDAVVRGEPAAEILEHGAPRRGLLVVRALRLGDRGQLPPRETAPLPLATLRKLVETKNVGEGLAAFVLHLDQLAGCHWESIIPVSFGRWSRGGGRGRTTP